jgi:hypothetical protein
VEFKSEITFFDKVKLIGYNLIEPLLVSTMLGSTVEIAEMGTIYYTLAIMIMLVPLLLTDKPHRINYKIKTCYTILIMNCLCIFMKTWIYCQFTVTKNVDAQPLVQYSLGIYFN